MNRSVGSSQAQLAEGEQQHRKTSVIRNKMSALDSCSELNTRAPGKSLWESLEDFNSCLVEQSAVVKSQEMKATQSVSVYQLDSCGVSTNAKP